MASISMEQLKAAFNKTTETREGGGRANNYYPFWNMKDGESAVIRFLPDKNTENPLGFVVEKSTHTLIINGEKKTIPCRKMYGAECSVCKVSSSFYKEEGKGSPNGKKYWRKKGHIAQALVVEDPLPADAESGENHQGKVRYIALGYQLFKIIQMALASGEMDSVPYDYEAGYNFIITKSKQGDYSTYTIGSRFKGKPSGLSDEDVEIIKEQIVDLSTLIPRDLGDEKMTSMLEAALTGSAYEEGDSSAAEPADEDDVPTPVVAKSASLAKRAPVASLSDEDEEETVVAKPVSVAKAVAKPTPSAAADADDSGDDEADAILAQIHARRNAKLK